MIHCTTLKAMNKRYTLSSGKFNATVKEHGRGDGGGLWIEKCEHLQASVPICMRAFNVVTCFNAF